MKYLNLFFTYFFLISCTSISKSKNNIQAKSEYRPSRLDLQKADAIARESAGWFQYTTGSMKTEHSGQCGDYAVRFVLKYNEYAGKNVARIVVANNPIPSGTYRIGQKTDVAKPPMMANNAAFAVVRFQKKPRINIAKTPGETKPVNS